MRQASHNAAQAFPRGSAYHPRANADLPPSTLSAAFPFMRGLAEAFGLAITYAGAITLLFIAMRVYQYYH